MSSQTPNINLTLPTGAEKVSRQIINDNNTKIDTAIGTLNSNIGNLKYIENPSSVQEITNALPTTGNTAVVFFSGEVATLFNTSGANYGIFTKGASTPRWDYVFAKQNGIFDIGNIQYNNNTPAITSHQINIANTISKVGEFTIAANSSKSFTLPSDGVYLLAGYGSAVALQSGVFLIGGYSTASRCSVANLTGITSVSINASNTSSLTFTASNNNQDNSITFNIIKLR